MMGMGMAGQQNAAPVIIKRKKVVDGGGHHGGAWKVAYADFVTAMMAFFLLMWLLNATTEKQRKGLADYFNPTIPINRISGGGDGAFGGDSIRSSDMMVHDGIGAPTEATLQSSQPQGQNGPQLGGFDPADQARLKEIEQKLAALSGESMISDRLMRHVVTRLSDEGLVIEIFDLQEAPLFVPDSDDPTPLLHEVLHTIAEVSALAINRIAVVGHVRSYPVTLAADPVWDLSTARAQSVRGLLAQAGLDPARMQRVTGYADRRPATADPTAARNNRIEVILLRQRTE